MTDEIHIREARPPIQSFWMKAPDAGYPCSRTVHPTVHWAGKEAVQYSCRLKGTITPVTPGLGHSNLHKKKSITIGELSGQYYFGQKGQSYCSQRWANPVWPKGSKSSGFSRGNFFNFRGQRLLLLFYIF